MKELIILLLLFTHHAWARTRIYERGNLDSAEDLWAWVQPPQQKSDPVGKWQCT